MNKDATMQAQLVPKMTDILEGFLRPHALDEPPPRNSVNRRSDHPWPEPIVAGPRYQPATELSDTLVEE